MSKKLISPAEIEKQYFDLPRLAQERSDFLLPQIYSYIKNEKWVNLRPEYQRRLVWDNPKKSKFIESLLMNIPVPPIFIFESTMNRYEVMDGQQRLNTIVEFYENRLKLSGLKRFPMINGLIRERCPKIIQDAIDRRRITATVLLAENVLSLGTVKGAQEMRREVFERLNTGGIKLNSQELRNSMYEGPLNNLIVKLAGNDRLNDVLGIPRYSQHYNMLTKHISSELTKNEYFKRMQDCELVLRFFALREEKNIVGSIKSILDRFMETKRVLTAAEEVEYERSFLECLEMAHSIFGDRTFQIQNENHKWTISEPVYDSVMVAIYRLKLSKVLSVTARSRVKTAFNAAVRIPENYELLVGRGNTAATIKSRIDFMTQLIRENIA